MKTQEQIVERIKTTKNTHVHANAMLALFLDRAHQIEVLGSRIAHEIPIAARAEFKQQFELKDIGPMLIDLIAQARDWPPDDNGHAKLIQSIRKERIEALTWLVDDDAFFDWTRSLRDLLSEIEARYEVAP